MTANTNPTGAASGSAAERARARPSAVYLHGATIPDPEPFRSRLSAALATAPEGFSASCTIHVRTTDA